MHKLVCKQLATRFHTSNCPTDHSRAILLPQNQKKPRILWVKKKPDGEYFNEINGLLARESEYHLQHQNSGIPSQAININSSIPNRRCGRGLSFDVLSRVKISATNGLKLNECMVDLAPAGHIDTQHGSALVWAYLYKADPVSEHDQSSYSKLLRYQPRNFGARDFRSLIDFLHSQAPNACVIDPERFVLHHDHPIVTGIKVNCDGDVERFCGHLPDGVTELSRFESVLVPLNVPGMPAATVTWAKLMGLSWAIRLIPSNRDLEKTDLANFNARYLGRCSEVVKEFGPNPIPTATTEGMGSVIFMRRDGGSIHRLHVNWLTSYIDEITKEQGSRLQKLCRVMAMGHEVTATWGDLRLSWLTFLKNKRKASGGTIVSPWVRIDQKC